MPITASDANPPDDDLAEVLHYVAQDKLKSTRPKIARSPDTRAFLETGLQLLREDFLDHRGDELDGVERCRLFESISVHRLVERAEQEDRTRAQNGEKPLVLTTAKHRERWRHKNRYTEDLIAYLFRVAPQRAYMQLVSSLVDDLIATETLGGLIRTLARLEVEMVVNDALFPLHAIVEVALPNHPRVQEFLRNQENLLLPAWAAVYERIGDAYGVSLTPSYTWHDLAVLLNSMINGVLATARTMNGQTPPLSNGDSVLAGAILAMLPAVFGITPTDVDTRRAIVTPNGTSS